MKKFINKILLATSLIGVASFFNGVPVFADAPCDPGIETCFYDWVDKEIKLEVDVSESISDAEYTAQLKSYVTAFRSLEIQKLIAANRDGIAVSLGMWSNFQDRPIANLDLLDTQLTSIVDHSVFPNSDVGSEWFILRYNGINDPNIGITDPLLNPAYAFSNIIDYYSNIDYRTTFLNGFIGNATNPAGAIRAANDGYLTNDLSGAGAPDYNASGFINNVTGDPFQFAGIAPGDNGNPYIRAAYEQIIDISTDGIQNTDIDGNNVQSGDQVWANGNGQNCLDITGICQDALDTAISGFFADRGTVVNAVGVVGDVDPTLFNFDGVQTIGTYIQTGANVTASIPTVSTSDPNYQPSNGTLGPLAQTNSPNTGAIGLEADCFDNGSGTGGCISGSGTSTFTPILIQKLEAELQPVPFEFQPGYGLILGLGIFGFRYWQQEKKQKLDLDKSEGNEDSKIEIETVKTQEKEKELVAF